MVKIKILLRLFPLNKDGVAFALLPGPSSAAKHLLEERGLDGLKAVA